jgi:hypothetical protein
LRPVLVLDRLHRLEPPPDQELQRHLAAIITWPQIPLFLPRLISPEFLR